MPEQSICIYLVCYTKNYGGPQLSHQKQIAHIKNKLLTSKTNCSHQKQIAHIKFKLLTSKTNCSHQIQIAHIKSKLLTSNSNSSHQKQIANRSHQNQTQKQNHYSLVSGYVEKTIPSFHSIFHLTAIFSFESRCFEFCSYLTAIYQAKFN